MSNGACRDAMRSARLQSEPEPQTQSDLKLDAARSLALGLTRLQLRSGLMFNISWVAPDTLTPNRRNPRTHSKKKIRQIASNPDTIFGNDRSQKATCSGGLT